MPAVRIDDVSLLGAAPRSTLVVIGNFDGVHLGHQAVLRDAAEEARARGLRPVVLTFDPHPSVVLGKGVPSVLTTMDRRVELMGRAAPGLTVVVQRFTVELSELVARDFVERILLGALGASEVLVGENFCFGRGRQGDVKLLAELGRELGFGARAHALMGDTSGAYSSSRVRATVTRGDVSEAARMLGRPYALSGEVVRGDARGRSIGFPTANLARIPELLPDKGVYACLIDRIDELGGARALARAVTNVGDRPTVGAGPSVEAHLLDFQGDLYGAQLRVHLWARLRAEQRFESLDALVRQIGSDVEHARRLLQQCEPDPELGGAWG